MLFVVQNGFAILARLLEKSMPGAQAYALHAVDHLAELISPSRELVLKNPRLI